ncbi:DUF1348 family protein [Gluconobacter frateurii]|uniref:DUF1348 family protein n=1 Tax=Gluconobacter frateurii TaxID=38308 RepID=UPI0038D00978
MFRSFGNERWELDENGRMARCGALINDLLIDVGAWLFWLVAEEATGLSSGPSDIGCWALNGRMTVGQNFPCFSHLAPLPDVQRARSQVGGCIGCMPLQPL